MAVIAENRQVFTVKWLLRWRRKRDCRYHNRSGADYLKSQSGVAIYLYPSYTVLLLTVCMRLGDVKTDVGALGSNRAFISTGSLDP